MSEYVRDLPFLRVGVDDGPGPESDRATIERNAIALTSNVGKPSIDPRAENWLGQYSPVEEIRASGRWNINHVAEAYDPEFLDTLNRYVERTLSLD